MILVTGASGFVGGHLCSMLAERGKIVRGAARQDSMSFFGVGDLLPTTDWTKALNKVDSVIHLAARVHIGRETADDPLSEYRRVNSAATLNLARQALLAGVRRFVFVSSIAVNGNATEPGRPFTEADAPKPHDDYGRSKLEAENDLRELSREGMEVAIIRPPLVYGPGVPSNFRSMMHWLSKGVPLPLASINNRRSMVSVHNLCDLLFLCLDHPAAANQTFLVSDAEDLSTPDLLRRVGAALGRPARLLPFPPGLLRTGAEALRKPILSRRLLASLQVDTTKARSLLGWSPPQSVDEAIIETAQHFKNNFLPGKRNRTSG